MEMLRSQHHILMVWQRVELSFRSCQNKLPYLYVVRQVATQPCPIKCSYRYLTTSPDIIQLAVMLYVRFSLSLRNVEDLLHKCSVDVSYKSVRHWWHRFGS